MIVAPDTPDNELGKKDNPSTVNRNETTSFSNEAPPPSYYSQFAPPSGPPLSSQRNLVAGGSSQQGRAFDTDSSNNPYFTGGFAQNPNPYPTPSSSSSSSKNQPSSSRNNDNSFLDNFKASPRAAPSYVPPASFNRSPPPQLPYSAFPPLTLLGISNDLSDGFPLMPPPTQGGIHPFVGHDTNEEDWTRFLGDLGSSARVNGVRNIAAQTEPTMGRGRGPIGMLAGLLIGALTDNSTKSNTGPVVELVDAWNRHFFHPRLMNITLAQGPLTYSGPHKGERLPRSLYQHDDYDDGYASDSNIDYRSRQGGLGLGGGGGMIGGRHERMRERRERRYERRERRRERRGMGRDVTIRDERWRLVVEYFGRVQG